MTEKRSIRGLLFVCEWASLIVDVGLLRILRGEVHFWCFGHFSLAVEGDRKEKLASFPPRFMSLPQQNKESESMIDHMSPFRKLENGTSSSRKKDRPPTTAPS